MRAYDVLRPDDALDGRPGAAVAAEVFLPMHYRLMQSMAQVAPAP